MIPKILKTIGLLGPPSIAVSKPEGGARGIISYAYEEAARAQTILRREPDEYCTSLAIVYRTAATPPIPRGT